MPIKFNDPRPDLDILYHDGPLWEQIFAISYEMDSSLFGLLHGFRCQGSRLEKGPNGYAIRPVISKDSWPDQQAYERYRDHYLIPYKDNLIEVLDQLKG